jgi:hypothetical protein
MDNSWSSDPFSLALEAHRHAGYPALNEKEQAHLLLGRNPNAIPALPKIPELDSLPGALMKRYVFLSRQSFRPYFIASDYIERSIQSHKNFPQHDGDFIVSLPDGKYKIIYQERGNILYEEGFENKDMLVNNLINKLFEKYQLGG